jgi:hypothetical protein
MRVMGGVLAGTSLSPADLAVVAAGLADAYEREGEGSVACAYRITAAELRPTDPRTVARAIRCEGGGGAKLPRWTQVLKETDRKALTAELAKTAPALDGGAPGGDIVAAATWDAPGVDLDVGILDPNGNRVAWVGRTKGMRVDGAKATGKETLALSTSAVGPFVVEIARVSGANDPAFSSAPISGKVTVRALGSTQTVPFLLTGSRAQVARIDVHFESELVPFDGPIDTVDPFVATPPTDAKFDFARADMLVRNSLRSAEFSCRQNDGPFGAGSVTVTFEPTGRVRTATMDGSDLRGSLVAGCILQRVRVVRVNPYAGSSPVTLTFPVTVPSP